MIWAKYSIIQLRGYKMNKLYYRKLIYYFPFNLIFRLQALIWERRADKEYNERSINQDV